VTKPVGMATRESPLVTGAGASGSPGAMTGKYRLTRLLGHGGMGSVYAGVHMVIGRPVALKFLRPEMANNEVLVRRLRREAAAAGALVSEHIAAVTDFDIAEDGTPYIVMELLEGESLSDRLRRGPLSVREAITLGIQVCRGLAVAHGRGIIHRDLTPSNVFLCRGSSGDPVAKILDFGIALGTQEGTSVITGDARAGTAPYMAPERARGREGVDRRVDLYALGAILYEALAGERAHPGDAYGVVIYHVLRDEIVPLDRLRPELPAGLVRIIHRALAFDAGGRFGSAEEMEAALAALAQPGAITPIVAAAPGRRRWLGGVVVAAVLAATGALAARRQAPSESPPAPVLARELSTAPVFQREPPTAPLVPPPVSPAPAAVSAPLAARASAKPVRHKRRREEIDRERSIAQPSPVPPLTKPPLSQGTNSPPETPDPVTFERHNPYE
jgi:tRNA A-37 threonylcarbamoyl transferase component Bud32